MELLLFYLYVGFRVALRLSSFSGAGDQQVVVTCLMCKEPNWSSGKAASILNCSINLQPFNVLLQYRKPFEIKPESSESLFPPLIARDRTQGLEFTMNYIFSPLLLFLRKKITTINFFQLVLISLCIVARLPQNSWSPSSSLCGG